MEGGICYRTNEMYFVSMVKAKEWSPVGTGSRWVHASALLAFELNGSLIDTFLLHTLQNKRQMPFQVGIDLPVNNTNSAAFNLRGSELFHAGVPRWGTCPCVCQPPWHPWSLMPVCLWNFFPARCAFFRNKSRQVPLNFIYRAFRPI